MSLHLEPLEKVVTYVAIAVRVPQRNDWYIDKFGDVRRQVGEKFSKHAQKKIIVRRQV